MLILYFENSTFSVIRSWPGRVGVTILLVTGGSDRVGSTTYRVRSGPATENGPADIFGLASMDCLRSKCTQTVGCPTISFFIAFCSFRSASPVTTSFPTCYFSFHDPTKAYANLNRSNYKGRDYAIAHSRAAVRLEIV